MIKKVKKVIDQHIRTLSDYFEYLKDKCDKDLILFRGQREVKDLKPKIARINPRGGNILECEENIFKTFKREAATYLNPYPENDWGWLAIAQNHSLPTRLLDWTKNPLAALWFAVKEPSRNSNKAVVWIFESKADDYFGEDDQAIINPFKIRRTFVFEPSHINPRIRAQEGIFTIHKFMERKGAFLPLNKNINYKKRLTRILIEPFRFHDIRKELDRCGINSSSLFPDLEGVANRVRWKYTKLDDED